MPPRTAQPIDEMLQQAAVHHQRGRLQEAARLYHDILQSRPDHFQALHLLGLLDLHSGKAEDAARRLR